MKGFEKSSVEKISMEEQENDIAMNDVIEEDEWDSFDEAIELVIDGANDIKRITDLCIQEHFSEEEKKHFFPFLLPICSDPDAGMQNDTMAPFAVFEARDIEGKVVFNAEIAANGLYVFKYCPDGSDTLIMDDAPYYHMEDKPSDNPDTIMYWAMFTQALTYLLKFGYAAEVLQVFCIDTTWEWRANNEA